MTEKSGRGWGLAEEVGQPGEEQDVEGVLGLAFCSFAFCFLATTCKQPALMPGLAVVLFTFGESRAAH